MGCRWYQSRFRGSKCPQNLRNSYSTYMYKADDMNGIRETFLLLGLLSPTFNNIFPSVLWRCWLGGRKGIRPVKTEWWATGVVICLEQGTDLHMAQLMPLPHTVSCYSKIQIGLTFWYWLTRVVPEKGLLNGCVCVLPVCHTEHPPVSN